LDAKSKRMMREIIAQAVDAETRACLEIIRWHEIYYGEHGLHDAKAVANALGNAIHARIGLLAAAVKEREKENEHAG